MPHQIALVLTPNFNAMATIAFLDPLRAANYLNNGALYRWRLFSSAGGELPASNGMTFKTEPLTAAEDWPVDLAVVSSSWTPEAAYGDERLMGRLRRWARRGAAMGGLDTGAFILAEAGLSYLGLGVQPPQPSWGKMLADAQTFMFTHPLQAVFPGAAIMLAVLGLNLLGDGLRDTLDPRLKVQRL